MCIPTLLYSQWKLDYCAKASQNLHDSVKTNRGPKILILSKISEDTDTVVNLTNKYFLLFKGAYHGFSISETIHLM